MATKKVIFFWDTTNNGIIQDRVKKNGFVSGEQSEGHSKQKEQNVKGHVFWKMKYLEEIQVDLYGCKLRVQRGNRGD